MEKYIRVSLPVEAVKYEPDQGIEDGFELLTKIVTNGWIKTDNLFQIKREDGNIICPFIINKRGKLFIRNGDYIIFEADSEKHVCSSEKFHLRFKKAE